MKLKVLFVAQEITPYVPENEMSLICRQLPQGIQESGQEIRIFMPKFGYINERRNQLHEVIRLSGMNLVINDTDHPLVIKVASIQPVRIQVYFIDNEDLFPKKFMITDKGKDNFDADEKAIFFCKGIVETVKKLGWAPDVIHCHGWFSSLFPFYMKKVFASDPLFMNSFKIIYSIYDDKYTGAINPEISAKIMEKGIYPEDLECIKDPTWINLTKFAIDNSDGIIIATQNIDPEIAKYIEDKKIPVLGYSGEDKFVERCNNFYNKIAENKI